ncbi:MAG: hypothetical protein ACOC1F_12055, partial [Myxococcota bacterium]
MGRFAGGCAFNVVVPAGRAIDDGDRVSPPKRASTSTTFWFCLEGQAMHSNRWLRWELVGIAALLVAACGGSDEASEQVPNGQPDGGGTGGMAGGQTGGGAGQGGTAAGGTAGGTAGGAGGAAGSTGGTAGAAGSAVGGAAGSAGSGGSGPPPTIDFLDLGSIPFNQGASGPIEIEVTDDTLSMVVILDGYSGVNYGVSR